MAQLNLTVGDIEGNLAKLIRSAEVARDDFQSQIIVFPELSLTGYPPDDLLFRKALLDAELKALNTLKNTVNNIYCIVGHSHLTSEGLVNSTSVIYNGTILGRYGKQHLPNYGVFDEARYFIPGSSSYVIPINGIPVGVVICEDLWFPGPVQQAANDGARIILSPNASPFEINKHELRHLTLAKRAKAVQTPIVYVNCVGGQDELIFDGGSMVVDHEGKICQLAGFFQEALTTVDFEVTSTETKIQPTAFDLPSEHQRIYDSLILGVKDYITKNNFKKALIGVSGGIDSALTLAIAVDALGKENVHAVLLPSRYTAEMSIEDSLSLIKNIGVKHDIISIEPAYKEFLTSLKTVFSGKKQDVTEENLQSRCRGVIMMALSNKFGGLVLTTGNRSELAVGYATLYGDMAGGFNVLKDIYKTQVYQLAHYRNQITDIIPQRIIERAPSAELAPNQLDQDTLPPYEVLDKILELYLDQELDLEAILIQGFDKEITEKVIRLVKNSEYKRRQAPLGIRINHKSFGRDRRYPVTSKW